MTRSGVIAFLVCTLLPLAGCAAIPDELPAKGVTGVEGAPRTAPVAEPERGLAPDDLIRNFIQVSGNPENDYATAKPYLTKAAQTTWQPESSVTIIQDTFGTRYDSAVPSGPAGPATGNHTSIVLSVQRVGVLDRDKSFIPEPEASEISIQLDKRADGQWRISTPPQGTFITLSKFTEIYRQVPLYFLDPQKRVLVPDPRYVAAQPTDQVPGRIIDLLLGGPSDGLQDAVTSALAPNTALRTGVVFADDGALQVNLTKPGDTSPGNVKLIVAQIVESLRTATNAKIRIQVEGAPLVTDHPDWQIGDLPAYDTITNPSSDLPGMVVVNSRVRQLDDGKPIRGPAGAGDYPVTSAAQSIDGTELALVGMATSTAAQLRVGEVNSSAALVDLAASSLTRPTWLSTSPGGSGADTGNEVWTVADGSKVIRVIKSANGDWVARTVNASALSPFGAITALRLSRDGVRAALVAGGRLVVASVVRVPGSDTVTIRAPRLLQPYGLSEVVGVDWLGADQLVVVTSAQAVPVVQVMVDGGPVGYNRYNLANLSPPMIAVTAAPGRPVIAVDADGMWTSSDIGSVWHPHAVAIGRGSTAIPFYPG